MDRQKLAIIFQEGGRLVSQLMHAYPWRRAETATIATVVEEEAGMPVDLTETSAEKKVEEIATGCVPCAIGHFGTCSGLLNEAMRFARKDGVGSDEVVDRINMCLDELNTMERVDLRPQLIANLPEVEKKIANRALNESRQLRHGLEGIDRTGDLEGLAATTQTVRRDIGRDWFNYRQSRITSGGEELSLDDAKKMAAEQAAQEVERRWAAENDQEVQDGN